MAEAHAKPQHDYHLVDPSPWPVIGGVGALTLAIGAVMYFISKKAGTPHLWYVIPGFAHRHRHHVRLVARGHQGGA